jgi:integrase
MTPQRLAEALGVPALPTAVVIRMNKLRPSTQLQYINAWNRFVSATDGPIARDAKDLDAQLEQYAATVFDEKKGVGRQSVSCARLAAIWLNPTLHGQLPLSGAVCELAAWNRAAGRAVQRHPPITWPLTLVVARRMMAAGHNAAGVAVVLGFDCALRINEAAALRIGDVRELALVDRRLLRAGGPELVVSIRDPKTSIHNELQSMHVLNPAVTAVMRAWITTRKAAGATDSDPMFGLTAGQLHYLFINETARLGAAVRFTWHSLRHGMATFLFMAGWHSEDVMHHGRWASAGSARRYQQAGRAAAAAHGAPQTVVQEGERIAEELGSAAPPPPSAAPQET